MSFDGPAALPSLYASVSSPVIWDDANITCFTNLCADSAHFSPLVRFPSWRCQGCGWGLGDHPEARRGVSEAHSSTSASLLRVEPARLEGPVCGLTLRGHHLEILNPFEQGGPQFHSVMGSAVCGTGSFCLDPPKPRGFGRRPLWEGPGTLQSQGWEEDPTVREVWVQPPSL